MGIMETNDAGLRQFINDRTKVFVMFPADHCATCAQRRTVVELCAINRAYTGIAFLHRNADHNPIARQAMQQQLAPFFTTYCQGRLVESHTLHTEQQVRALLNALDCYPSVNSQSHCFLPSQCPLNVLD